MGFAAAFAAMAAFAVFDYNYPPPLGSAAEVSIEVVDSDERLLRAFATAQGRWRLKTRIDQIDKEFIKILIAYEDQRFWSHHGVDARAMLRAAWQLIRNGRIISGGSTITMQLARLLEPRQRRALKSKVLQALRALQIERRLSKVEILERYLTLAPYGGNLEGIRAASLAYFGKEPRGLSLAQSALLVALPQSPERRRPDRYSKRAKQARNTVLARVAEAGIIAPAEVERVKSRTVSAIRLALPHHAAHLARRLLKEKRQSKRYAVTLKRGLQRTLETVARNAVRKFEAKTSVALILADAKSGKILAEVGSPNYLDVGRSGWLDMTRAIRSPGSALKPFIYGAAFEEGLIRPETLIMDSPTNFAGYRPQNFDMKYQGEVSIRSALQLSLNVPAVQLLESVGPARLTSKFKRAGVDVKIPLSKTPGLAIALGGLGISLRDIVQLYTALANGGKPAVLHNQQIENSTLPVRLQSALLRPVAAWHVTDILSGTPPPNGSKALGIAYKTGTSYGYRDAWSVGYDGRYVLGVWVGRADNGSVPGITGRSVAAPILFEAFEKSGLGRVPFKQAPAGALRATNAELPVTLQRFRSASRRYARADVPEPPPQIIYPPKGARIELGKTAGGMRIPLVMKLQDGRPPFRWLANGNLFSKASRKRIAMWEPDGAGYSTLTVIDAGGRAASVKVHIDIHN